MPPQQNEKVAFTKRLNKEGRYDAYVDKREALKLEGVDPILAWRVAAAYFYPRDGSPHEISDLPRIPDPEPGDLDGRDYVPERQGLGPKPKVYEPAAPLEPDFALDASDVTAADVEGPKPAKAEKFVLPLDKKPPKEELAVDDDPEQVDYSDIRGGSEADRIERKWHRLYRKVSKKKKANPAVVADWIFNNADATVEELHPKDVPNRGAITLLRHVQSSATFFKDFINSTYVKLMPTRQEMQQYDKTTDKHKLQTGMLDAFIEDFEAREAERERQEMLADQEQG